MALIRGHYVPKFYLRGFTVGGGEDDELFVFDQLRRRSWPSTPVNAAKEAGMYAADGPDPEIIERAMAQGEAIASRVIRDVITTGMLPTGDDWTEFLGFIAVMLVRVPKYRERYFQKLLMAATGQAAFLTPSMN